MSRRTRLAGAVATAVLLTLPAGCVTLPDDGPIVEVDGTSGADEVTGVKYDPLPPLPDASRSEIVKGFLDAMTAVPIQTTSAAEFLTAAARTSWQPEQETITYGDRSPAVDSSTAVTVRMFDGANRFDSRGAWSGSLGSGQLDLRFGLEMEQGEWRISDVPNALIVPETWFETRFRRLSLSFFDASARILVPEPVFVANDDALATRLVEGLLDGPGTQLGRSSRSFFPPGTKLGLSVPVSPDGMADVSLSGVGGQAPESQLLMVSQLTATLRQVVGITSVRVQVDGELIRLPGGDDGQFAIDFGADLGPEVPGSSAIVFGVRDRRLVAGIPEALEPVLGPFGTGAIALRSAAVNLRGTTAAVVTPDGGSVLVAPVNGDPDSAKSILDRGTDLLEPSWDFTDRLWLVDRRAGGARVRYYEDGRVHSLDVPGVTGADVRSFLVSRDGSRLVVVIADEAGDELMVSRILHRGGEGEVRSATPARVILRGPPDPQSIKDVAWLSPTSIAVLTGGAGELHEVQSVAVDGAPTSVESIASFNGPVRSLAGSPVAGQGLLVLAPDEARDLSGPVSRRIEFPAGQEPRSLEYVG